MRQFYVLLLFPCLIDFSFQAKDGKTEGFLKKYLVYTEKQILEILTCFLVCFLVCLEKWNNCQ